MEFVTSDVGLLRRIIAGPLIKYFKSQNCIVLHKCTTVRHAKVRYHISSRQ